MTRMEARIEAETLNAPETGMALKAAAMLGLAAVTAFAGPFAGAYLAAALATAARGPRGAAFRHWLAR